MAKSVNSRKVEDVARRIGEAYLNRLGFRLASSIFRRTLEPGFIQIVDFGLGPSWSMYRDQFTVDVCLFIAEAYKVFYDAPAPSRPTTIHCELRQRLGMLNNPPKDRWWPVSQSADSLTIEVGGDIERLALPFLARIASRRAVVDEWFISGSDALGFKPRGDLVIASILAQLGDKEVAERVLNSAVVRSRGQRFEEFFVKSASKINECLKML